MKGALSFLNLAGLQALGADKDGADGQAYAGVNPLEVGEEAAFVSPNDADTDPTGLLGYTPPGEMIPVSRPFATNMTSFRHGNLADRESWIARE